MTADPDCSLPVNELERAWQTEIIFQILPDFTTSIEHPLI